jgi:type III pantothenate kinase
MKGSMHHFFIDIGNSFIKAAAFTGNQWKLIFRSKIDNESGFYSWLSNQKNEKIVICSVLKRITQEIVHRVPENRLEILNRKKIPESLFDYQSADSLGMDRFFSCYGAWKSSEGAVVVIDAGSACTIDYMNDDSVFGGGIIMPGHRLLLRSVSADLPELPNPDGRLPDTWPGKTTNDCLRWGTTGVFIMSITGFLEKYRRTYGDFGLYITGGDAEILKNHVDDYPVQIKPFLIFEGMKAFYEKYLEGDISG